MAQKAFDLPEILEAILLELDDHEDLLISRRVCTQWKATWSSSIRIQRRLFLAPAEAGDEWVQGRKISPKDVQRLFDGVDLGDEELHASICKHGITLNPLVTPEQHAADTVEVKSHFRDRTYLIETRMFVTQPPLRMETWQLVVPGFQLRDHMSWFEEEDMSGLTLGELSDKLKASITSGLHIMNWVCAFVDVNGKSIFD
ncbi:hypothetical protein PRZ48_014907 [Zasmidium cellare]|uniref:F-box domain-containing protein n=1 Tax=Zasmidium cellare TaxID=395010 RepID=A0ABR0DX31_ZASCE|nr:hypothetical protein PRZ48_014907 [Zasmidium cellare]